MLEYYQLAHYAHRNQTRKNSGLPYIIHPLRVTDMVRRVTADPCIRGAALCHDVLEDGDEVAKLNFLASAHPLTVSIVKELTKEEGADKAAYLASFVNKSIEALAIKICDRYDNVMDFVNEGSHTKAVSYADEGSVLWTILEDRKLELMGTEWFAESAFDYLMLLEKDLP